MAQQKITLKIPKRFKPAEREAISQLVVDFIVDRTRDGNAINGSPWKGKAGEYTKRYINSLDFKNAGKNKGRVDVTLSGETLDALEGLGHKRGEITVGYDKADKDLNGKVEGNRKGTYGTGAPIPGKARDFLGITRKDLKAIYDQFPSADDQARLERVEAALAVGVTSEREDT